MPVHVRDAVGGDTARLTRLWADLVPLRCPESSGEDPKTVVRKAVLRHATDDQARILVAEMDGAVVGCAYLRLGVVSPLDDSGVVHLSHVQVDPAFGRQGVGSALVEAAVTWAELRGVGFVMTAAPAGDRGPNRFLARLGMAQMAVLRGGTVATLRGRLPHAPAAATRQNPRAVRSLEQVVAVRRSQRRARTQRVTS